VGRRALASRRASLRAIADNHAEMSPGVMRRMADSARSHVS
jgi:hypothetical protein